MDPFDPVDTNWKRWMPNDARFGNEVIPYQRLDQLFLDIAAAFRTATTGGHFIYILAWNLEKFLLDESDPSTDTFQMLSDASARGVQVAAMLFEHNPLNPARNNQPIVDHINALPNGVAIHDSKLLMIDRLGLRSIAAIAGVSAVVGAHHQKIIVVQGDEGLVAFQGGVDLDPNRRTLGGGPGLHDVHVRVRGPAAERLHGVFVERWRDHPAASSPIFDSVSVPSSRADDLAVVVARTYGNGNAHAINGVPYAFAASGSTQCRDLIHRAIAAARKFIYLEDQYLVDMSTSAALLAALPNIERLIILVCHPLRVNVELFQVNRRHREFLNPLRAAAPDKVLIATHRHYVHSKTWVFDDRYAIIGSANVNRRGMTHDSEQVVGVFDVNKRKRWFWAHELRMNLWAKHLALAPFDTRDPIAASVHWEPGRLRGLLEELVPTADVPAPTPFPTDDVFWDIVVDPDGS